MGVQAFKRSLLGLHIERVVERVVNTELLVDLSCTISLKSCKLGSLVIVKLGEVLFGDRPDWDSHIISDDLSICNQMLPLDAPANGAWDSRNRVDDSRLVVESCLLRAHLLSKESFEGWLVDSRLWILDLLFERFRESLLVGRAQIGDCLST